MICSRLDVCAVGVGTWFGYRPLDRNIRHDDSWTCPRSMDGVWVQMDSPLSSG